jgi:O-antigen/teichoic acid export membrane protein
MVSFRHMNIERRTIAALKWTGGARLITQVINWAVTLAVVRLLTPPDYGLMALALVVISFLATAAELGLGSSLVQVVQIEKTELARVTGAVMSLNLGVAVLLVASATMIALALHEPRAAAIIRVSAVQFVFSALSAVPQALLTRNLNFRSLAGVETVSGVLTNLSTLVLAWLGAGVWALVGGYQIGAGIRALLLVWRGGWVRPTFQLTGIKRHLRFGGTLTAARLTWQVSSQVDVLIAGRFLGSSAVGVYSVALNLASMPMQKIMSVVNQVAFPAVARIQEDPVTLRRHLTKALRLLAFVAVPSAWGLACVAPEFIQLAFGPKWSAVTLPLQILCLLIPVRMLGALLMTSAVAKGRASVEVGNTIITLLVLPPAFLVGVHWGVPGLAWAWVVGIAITYAIVIPRVSSILDMPLLDMVRAALPSVTAGVVMCVAVLGARSFVLAFAQLPVQLCLLIATGVVTYLLAVSVIDSSLWKDCSALMSA